jgi:hypothetical protein
VTSSYRIEQAMSAAMQIRAMLGDTEDEKLLADTIDGETDALEILDRLAEQALADEALVEGARERIKRLEARADRRRHIVLQMMEAMGLSKLERSLFTASVTHRSKAIVSDQSELPDAFIRHAPDLVALGKALRSGEQIPGASLSNPSPSLVLRTQ